MRWSLLLLVACLLPSCAWSNPNSRPVWNAFENSVVPDDDAWFYATLPVTVPLGVGAVVVDALVAHPIQVFDDALGDAGLLWGENGPKFASAYYTEMAYLPLRSVFTPIAFAGSWLGRSLFDIDPRMSEEQRQAIEQQRQAERRTRFVAWLERLLHDPGRPRYRLPRDWHEDYAEPMRAALDGDADARRWLHSGMIDAGLLQFGPYVAVDGLRDPDPFVRHAALREWPHDQLPPELADALCGDPVETVRLLARRRYGR